MSEYIPFVEQEPPPHRCKKKRRRRRWPWVVALVLFVVVPLLAGAGAGGVGYYEYRTNPACDLALLRPATRTAASFIYARDGSLLATVQTAEHYQPLPEDQISPWSEKAAVSIEDRRFWQHGGVDPVGIARAAYDDLAAGHIVSGASTIPQQLVRNLYLNDAQTWRRKLQEACLAMKLSHRWTRPEILTAYLNQVFYGHQAYGIEAAARTYFNRDAGRLTLVQAALLAGLPQAPSDYDPFVHPDRALTRRNEVLAAMLRDHQISPSTYQAALRAPLDLKAGGRYAALRTPQLYQFVVNELRRRVPGRYLRAGGLEIHTSLDPRMQSAARRSIMHQLPYRSDPAGALASVDPRSGEIRVLTSVRGPKQLNLAWQGKRQAGSTFKTYALTDAVLRGIEPDHTDYLSAPLYLYPQAGPVWTVHTAELGYAGSISLTEATVRSDNTVFARLALDLGPSAVVGMAHRLGVRSYLPAVPSIVLGVASVSPLEVASSYATLAAGGIYREPHCITFVEWPGHHDPPLRPTVRKRVLPDGVAATVTRVLAQNVARGTGTAAQIGRPQAGKTGTTDSFTDGWFTGYTPQLSTSVWVGYPNKTRSMTDVHGITVYGGTFPAEIWHDFSEAALWHTPVLNFKAAHHWPHWVYWHGQAQWASTLSR